MQTFTRHATFPAQFWNNTNGVTNWIILHEFRVDFTIDTPSILEWNGCFNFQHRGIGTTEAIGWGMKASLRHDPTSFDNMMEPGPSGVNLPYWQDAQNHILYGSKRSGNIRDLRHHYGQAPVSGHKVLSEPGCYRMDWYGHAHSAFAPGYNGLIDLIMNGDPGDATDPYSATFTKITPLE